ncbi:Cna B-type domain-containing protein [Erysipelothrix sp. HDW6A]|uniref:Cna B-type domain-containing protein n=1 Tax=Erysipelothrix sp. HDW6A TaxID=2714928 RepID=UPI00140DB655|nr:Cna B-type domain-containing protein [Erysipelothrix sp. HDW6A]QIK57078.1 Cna B-type domain-containing protein [Erysipelothrix sp. HDW6A]
MNKHFIRLGRVFLVMLLLLVNVNLDQKSSISALEGIPAGTIYESDENSTSLTLVGESTNSHTHPFMLWVQNDLVLIAVRSTHDLKSMDVIGTSTIHNIDMKVHADLEKITVDDKANLNPANDLSGDLKDAHWTIFSFPKSIISTNGTYHFFIEGIGNGHDVEEDYQVIIPPVKAMIEKTWINGPMPEIELTLQRRVLGSEYELATGLPNKVINNPITLTPHESGEASFVWDELPYTNTIGQIYDYNVKETNPGSGYTLNTTSSYDEHTLTYYFSLTNTYTQPLGDVSAKKTWVGGSVRTAVYFEFYRSTDGMNAELLDTVMLDGEVDEINSQARETSPWVYTWSSLPHKTIDGIAYNYYVVEVNALPNYISSGSGGLEVTNTYVIPLNDVTVSKDWVDGPLERPIVQLQLYRNGVAYLEPVSLENGISEYTWYDLEATDIDGNPYVYTVDEVDVPMNYEKSLSEDGLTVTNTYVIPVKDVTGYKEWIDGPVEKPTVELQLFRNGKTYLTPVKLESGTNDFTWYSLDGTDIYGNPYVYTVDEVNVPMNYEKSLSEDRLTVTNTYVIPLISITGTKVWINGPKDKPMIELQLYQDGDQYGDEIYLLNGDLSHTWFNVEQTDRMGNPYTYTIDEPTIPANYTKSISEDGLTITNTFHEPVKDVEVIPLPSTGIDDDSVATLVIVLIVGGIGVLLYQRRNRNKDRK